MNNLYLIGYRGCGKTTVAKLLSERLDSVAIDADEFLEQKVGRSIREIFQAEGEPAFRQWESDVVQELTSRVPVVISWGGGVVLKEANRALLRSTGRVVWLQASAETLLQRIEQDPTTKERRPNLTIAGGLDEVKHLLAVREPMYGELAHLTVDANDATPAQLAQQIAAWYFQHESIQV
jgi:shikimate kinase